MPNTDLITSLLGKRSVLPDNAEEVKPSKSEKSTSVDAKKFLPTELALVAPDCTPMAEVPLSPSLVPVSNLKPADKPDATKPSPLPREVSSEPKDDPALQAVLGKLPEGIPSISAFAMSESRTTDGAGDLKAGIPLPEHKPADISRTMDVFRRYHR